MLDRAPQSGFGADAAQDDDLAARPQHADELVERGFRIGHCGDDILRDHHVEAAVRKGEPLRVHDLERLDVVEPELDDALARLVEHRGRNVDADDTVLPRVVGQRDAGPDADLEDASADPLGRHDRGAPAAFEHRPEHQVVDRRPAVIGLFHCAAFDVDCYRHCVLSMHAIGRFVRG